METLVLNIEDRNSHILRLEVERGVDNVVTNIHETSGRIAVAGLDKSPMGHVLIRTYNLEI
jgi:hypothetical protein